MLYCILNTNIFLEFRPITEIAWLKELSAADVCLVVTSVVTRELDKHKSGSSNRLRKRARRTLAHLDSLDVKIDSEIRDGVLLRFDLAEPILATLESYNLSSNVSDDLLLAKTIEFRTQHPSSDIAILSDDRTVRFKARGHDLDVPELSGDYRLPHEIDPIEQENRELKNELLKLQNERPNLEIGFETDNRKLVRFSHADVSISAEYISELEVKSDIDRQRSEILRKSEIDESHVGRHASFLRDMTWTDTFEYGDYVESWLARKYAPFLRARSFHDVFHKRSIPVDLTIQNTGLGTAEGLNITLKISGDWRLEFESPDEPAHPGEPAPRDQWRSSQESVYTESLSDLSKLKIKKTNPANPIITRQVELNEPQMKIVRNSISRIRPDESLRLYPLFMFATNSECIPKNFAIEYEILKDNPGPKQMGQLSVVVNAVDT